MSLCKRSKKNEKRCTKNIRKQRSVVMSLPMFIPMWIDVIFQELLKGKYVFSAYWTSCVNCLLYFPEREIYCFQSKKLSFIKETHRTTVGTPCHLSLLLLPGLDWFIPVFTVFYLVFIYVYLCLLVFTDLFLQIFTNVNKCSAAVKCHDYPGEVYSSSYT